MEPRLTHDADVAFGGHDARSTRPAGQDFPCAVEAAIRDSAARVAAPDDHI